jgi:hypothetical protein
MNGTMAKEQRRNLAKALGETAADAVDRSFKAVEALNAQHQLLAHAIKGQQAELDRLKADTGLATKALERRADGLAKWGQDNETKIVGLANVLDQQDRRFTDAIMAVRRDLREAQTPRWRRVLRWFGTDQS